MIEHRKPTIDEIEMALSISAREEVIKIAKSGFPVSGWVNGKVVKIPPEEILAIHDPEALRHYEFADNTPPSVQQLLEKRPEEFRHCDHDVEILNDFKTASRAIVFMSVDWSGPERKRRKAFFQAIGRLHTLTPYRHIAAFILDEEVAKLRQRFRSKTYYAEHPLGCGSLFWLENGDVVCSAEHGFDYAEEVLTQTFCTWPRGEIAL